MSLRIKLPPSLISVKLLFNRKSIHLVITNVCFWPEIASHRGLTRVCLRESRRSKSINQRRFTTHNGPSALQLYRVRLHAIVRRYSAIYVNRPQSVQNGVSYFKIRCRKSVRIGCSVPIRHEDPGVRLRNSGNRDHRRRRTSRRCRLSWAQRPARSLTCSR